MFGKQKGWCPYYLARHMVQFANVVVYSYQYLLDPKVAGIISKDMQRETVVVFDEAHNIDNVCIEALSVSVRMQTLEGATRNLSKMSQDIERYVILLGKMEIWLDQLINVLKTRQKKHVCFLLFIYIFGSHGIFSIHYASSWICSQIMYVLFYFDLEWCWFNISGVVIGKIINELVMWCRSQNVLALESYLTPYAIMDFEAPKLLLKSQMFLQAICAH